MTTELKVGIFAAIIIVILVWATIRVGDKTAVSGGGYPLVAVFDNATGLKLKAPIELAGVQVGIIKDIELIDSRRARVQMAINKRVKLPDDSTAVLRTRGFLGETYIEIIPGTPGLPDMSRGEEFSNSMRTGDINSLVSQFNQIAGDIKNITGNLSEMMGQNQNAPINRIVENLDAFAQSIRDITLRNEANVARITDNMAAMTEQLRQVVASGRANIEESMDRIASITRKIDEGQGTVGRLVNDEETVDKLNEAVDNLNDTLGGFRRLETQIGYRAEYLTQSEDFKHYISLSLAPSPDKALLLDLVADPDPRPTYTEKISNVTVGGTTTQVTTETASIDRNKLRISAQLAKKFYDFTLRGGLIESTGGVGFDWDRGPLGVGFSAYDFQTRFGQRPHLKAWANVNVTRNFFVRGGADDIIARTNNPDWFVGAGFRFVDEDVKSFARFGGSSLIK